MARLGNALANMPPSSLPGSEASQMPLQGFSSSEHESVSYPATSKRPPPPPGGSGPKLAIRQHAVPEAPVMPYDPFGDPEYQQAFGNAALEHQIAHASYDPSRADQTFQARLRQARSALPKRAAAPAPVLPFRTGSASETERGPMAGPVRSKTKGKDFDGPLATSFGAKKAAASGSVSDSSRSARRGAINTQRPVTYV